MEPLSVYVIGSLIVSILGCIVMLLSARWNDPAEIAAWLMLALFWPVAAYAAVVVGALFLLVVGLSLLGNALRLR